MQIIKIVKKLSDQGVHYLSFYHTLLDIKRLLGECLLMLSLPGKASRRLFESQGSVERFNMLSRS